MDLERELRQALQRKSPPRGFDEKVLGRIASGEKVSQPKPPARWTALCCRCPLTRSLPEYLLPPGARTATQMTPSKRPQRRAGVANHQREGVAVQTKVQRFDMNARLSSSNFVLVLACVLFPGIASAQAPTRWTASRLAERPPAST
jgi:hypothetical protein